MFVGESFYDLKEQKILERYKYCPILLNCRKSVRLAHRVEKPENKIINKKIFGNYWEKLFSPHYK